MDYSGSYQLITSRHTSRTWVNRLVSSRLNHDISALYKTHKSLPRTKIAILDTGYDSDNAFFSNRTHRLADGHWKDFLSNSPAPLDSDGHGTHVLSIAMRIAPSADICVGRIAKNSDDFSNSHQRIAEVGVEDSLSRLKTLKKLTRLQAINWAVREMNADIISMSFGWPQETESKDISQAIWKAMAKRKDQILFFAAASNSGGDFSEWFPASHQCVTAVRATTYEGEFLGFNPPPDYSDADVIGTLGVDIPGASLDPEQPECEDTGTSFATPIAAAIGALALDAAKFAARSGNDVSQNRTLNALRTLKGMRRLLRADSVSRKMNDRSWYVSANSFCNQSERDRKVVIDYAALGVT